MEKFGLFKLQLILLISLFNINEIRGDSLTVLNLLFKGISDRLDTMELSFENRIDNAMKEVNTRLVLLENRVGINVPSLEKQRHYDVTGPKTVDISLDIKKTKRNLLKAMSIEKQIIRESVREYGDKLKEFKTDIIGIVETMNTTMERSNEYLFKKIEQNTKEQRSISSKTSDDLSAVSERIDGMDETIKWNQLGQDTTSGNVAVLEIKHEDHGKKIETMVGRINGIEHDHKVQISNLENRINKLDRITESTVISLNSTNGRINKLHGKTHGFTAYLTSTTKCQSDDVIVFESVDYNTGSYDTNTGMFTVPKSGTYLFVLSVTGTSRNNAYAMVRGIKDGKSWYGQYVYAENGDGTTASGSLIYYCEEGTQIWVASKGDYEFSFHRTTFSGVLLD